MAVYSNLTARMLSCTTESWLRKEVTTSGGDRNRYLDDFAAMRHRIALGDSLENWAAAKQKSHADRFPLWWQAFEENPLDDEQAARISFAGLMFISGEYRDQCYLQASDAEDYLARRSRGVGFSTYKIAVQRTNECLPDNHDFSDANIDIEGLKRHAGIAMNIGESVITTMLQRLENGDDMGVEDSPSVRGLVKAEKVWLKFVFDSFILGAKLRGGNLTKVPVLQPKSISAAKPPEVRYPFAGQKLL